MKDKLKEEIDKIIYNLLRENPDTVIDQDSKSLAYYSDKTPAIAFICRQRKDNPKVFKWFINDQRDKGSAYHGNISITATPDFPDPYNSEEIIRGRLWMNQKICSFYEREEEFTDDYIDKVNVLFDLLKLDPKDFGFEFSNSARKEGLKKWIGLDRSRFQPTKVELSPEEKKKIEAIKAKIAELQPMLHLTTGEEKKKIEAELERLETEIGKISSVETRKAAYRAATAKKIEPFEKGAGSVAAYKGRFPAIAEDKVRVYNKTLCPDLWSADKKLNPEVRAALLKIAFDFFKDTELKTEIKDVYLLGSAANYNWTPQSDIDVHILIDVAPLSMHPENAEKFMHSLVGKWNLEHDIKIKGHKVELYIQDVREKNASTAVYSLVNDAWIKEPTPEKIEVDTPLVQKKYTTWVNRINDVVKSEDEKKLKQVLQDLKNCRQAGLDKQGEYSPENLVFKILRSRGYIGKLKDTFNSIYDKKMSVRDGFDPLSVGPNPDATEGESNGSYYQQQINKMRQMEEVTQKDLRARHPHDPSIVISLDDKIPWDKLTLDNLKALKDKAIRTYNYYVKKKNRVEMTPEEQKYLQKELIFLNALNVEIKKRLKYINKPVNESDDYYMNYGHDRDGDWMWQYFLHGGEFIKRRTKVGDTHSTVFSRRADFEGRYDVKKKVITVADMSHLSSPSQNVDELPDSLLQRLKYEFGDDARIKRFYEEQTQGLKTEGYGAGKRGEDRLKIYNKDGSIRRWQIKSKDAPKTPKLPDALQELVNEILDKHLPIKS